MQQEQEHAAQQEQQPEKPPFKVLFSLGGKWKLGIQQEQQPEQVVPQEEAGEQTEQTEQLEKIIKHHVWGAMGVGLIPLPLVDMVGLTGIQLNMLRKLAQVYDVPFFKDTAKSLISSLVGSALPVAVAPGIISLVKFIPLVGQSVGAVTMPLMAGAATYALGKVFVQHFASGGTFLTLDPENVRAYYQEMFQEGQKISARMKRSGKESQEENAPENV